MVTEKIAIQGMADQSDAEKIYHALHDVWGIHQVEVSAVRGEVVVTYDEKAASFEDFKQAIFESGFGIHG